MRCMSPWQTRADEQIELTTDIARGPLRGTLRPWAAKLTASRKRGVSKTDLGLRQDIPDELDFEPSIDAADIGVAVAEGVVALTGSVDWYYQKGAAEGAVQNLLGVKALSNLIQIEPKAKPADLRQRIESALRRDAEIEAQGIRITVSDRSVTLAGKVRTLAERDAAERAAWAAPGVSRVIDTMTIGA